MPAVSLAAAPDTAGYGIAKWDRCLRENDNLHVLRTGPVFNKETAACQRYKSLFSHGFRSVSSVFSIHTFMSAEILIFSGHHCF